MQGKFVVAVSRIGLGSAAGNLAPWPSTFNTASWWQSSHTTHSDPTLRPHVGGRHRRAAVAIFTDMKTMVEQTIKSSLGVRHTGGTDPADKE